MIIMMLSTIPTIPLLTPLMTNPNGGFNRGILLHYPKKSVTNDCCDVFEWFDSWSETLSSQAELVAEGIVLVAMESAGCHGYSMLESRIIKRMSAEFRSNAERL